LQPSQQNPGGAEKQPRVFRYLRLEANAIPHGVADFLPPLARHALRHGHRAEAVIVNEKCQSLYGQSVCQDLKKAQYVPARLRDDYGRLASPSFVDRVLQKKLRHLGCFAATRRAGNHGGVAVLDQRGSFFS
jgi:hypothetical protein